MPKPKPSKYVAVFTVAVYGDSLAEVSRVAGGIQEVILVDQMAGAPVVQSPSMTFKVE